MSEVELAQTVSAWLRRDGWRTWHEVPMSGGRADIVAARHGLVWAVETKLRLGLDVIDQALDRRDGFRACVHGAVVAVPWTRSAVAGIRVCRKLNLGVITVRDGGCQIEVWPAFHRRANVRALLATLTPEYENQTPGRSGGDYWTPFKVAARELIYALAAAPGRRMPVAQAAALEAVVRYKGERSEPQLRRWLVVAVKHRWIPGLRTEGEGRTREVVLDVAAITRGQIAEFHLEPRRLTTPETP